MAARAAGSKALVVATDIAKRVLFVFDFEESATGKKEGRKESNSNFPNFEYRAYLKFGGGRTLIYPKSEFNIDGLGMYFVVHINCVRG